MYYAAVRLYLTHGWRLKYGRPVRGASAQIPTKDGLVSGDESKALISDYFRLITGCAFFVGVESP